MNQKNSSIVSIWNAERINYQRRYANMIIRDDENPDDQNNKRCYKRSGLRFDQHLWLDTKTGKRSREKSRIYK